MTERRAATIRGIVQGVGFRPFVHRLATELSLGGYVCNQAGRVLLEVEGERSALDAFGAALLSRRPEHASIDSVAWQPLPPRGERSFTIEHSRAADEACVYLSPDLATCDACLAELNDPQDRRCGYAFLNCTHCGPRLTIIRGAPYDRERTTMAGFALCPACRAEFANPADRRFHAQPIACPQCGPQLSLLDAWGEPLLSADPLGDFAAALCRGAIGAVKGLGGYHLACDAANEAAVAELRRRKRREQRPLAVMAASLADAEQLCEIAPAEHKLLTSARRPIVLLKRRQGDRLAPSVAPRNPWLGVLLPYTPLHELLLRAVGGRPLVMTSGNRSDEPIATDDADAQARLRGVADLFLAHNRPIHVRCDDSVTRVVAGRESPLRRSRGYAPQPIRLPLACPWPLLAVGGQAKGTFALGREREAFLSHHLGDLDHWEARQAFSRDVRLYEALFAVRPELIAHDLHPDYASTQYARERAADEGLATLAVQHHHAHVASCLAEHGLCGPAIGVAFDGTGYGTDGAIWGGEFLVADLAGFQRAAHLRYVGLPGGDQAVREPWRSAAAQLADAQCEFQQPTWPREPLRFVRRMLERGFLCPRTSSVGRLFDAVAAIAGVRSHCSFEGQAAMELEWLASETTAGGCYPFELTDADEPGAPLTIDVRPLVREAAADARRGVDSQIIARRFHSTLVEIIVATCARIRRATRLETVALSGGVFMNALLAAETESRLLAAGFHALRQQQVPPNDGGLSLGQAAVAAAQSRARPHPPLAP